MRAAAGWASMFGLISVAAVGGLALRASSSHYMIVWLLFLGLIWIVLPLWLIQLVWFLIRARKARDDSSVRMLPGPLTVGWLASAAALSLALGTAVATSDLERARSSAERALPIVENRLRDGGTCPPNPVALGAAPPHFIADALALRIALPRIEIRCLPSTEVALLTVSEPDFLSSEWVLASDTRSWERWDD